MNKIVLILLFLLTLMSFIGISFFTYKIKKILVEDFSSSTRSDGELWNYYSKIYTDYQNNELLRAKVTKGITEHYREVEKYRMSKKVAKPI